MKNSFCRICRGRFNLKYPPSAVDSKSINSIQPRTITIAVQITEGGEISENICWDCEETLLGFHKSTSEDNEDEPVVVDDDEILYKTLEKTKRIHILSKETEVIQIDSSGSDSEDIVVIPQDEIIDVEAASTVFEKSTEDRFINQNKQPAKEDSPIIMEIDEEEDKIPRGKVFESKQCPVCPYHSGVEYEVVYHIRQEHPQYYGDDLRFDTKEGDSILTRRIVFAHLWTFFECKECGKLYDRFWPHRKHITTHDLKTLTNGLKNGLSLNNNNNNNKVFITPKQIKLNIKNLKRPLDEINDSNERVKLFKSSHDNHSNVTNKTLVIKLHKSESKAVVNKQQSQSEKSKCKALLRKQLQLQARREKRRQKVAEEKKAAALKSKTIPKVLPKVIPKPTFKMPTQPAPRASSVVKPIVQKLSFVCKMCSKIFPSFLDWNNHMLRYHCSDEFMERNCSTENICKSCDKRFKDASILEKHVRFSHRRKNRNLNLEINGNDMDDECCQSHESEKDQSKEDEQSAESLSRPINESCSTALEKNHNLLSPVSALFCQYCGSLFASLEAMKAHEFSHITNEEVKRYFVSKPKV